MTLNKAVGDLDADSANNIHWPEEYGAVGDGTTDDQTAINDLFANENVCFFQPNTTYFVGGTVSILNSDRYVFIPESTTIQADLDNITSNRVLEVGDGSNSVSNVAIVGGGTLDGQSSAPGGSSVVEDEGGALNFHDVTEGEVQINILDAREYGVEIAQSSHIRVYNSDVDGAGNDGFSSSDGGHTKYGSLGSSVSQDVRFRDCHAVNCNDSGFEVDDGPTDVKFIDCFSDGNGDGFVIHSHKSEVPPKGCAMRGCVADGHSSMGFKIGTFQSNSVADLAIVDCISRGNQHGISCQSNQISVTDIRISDCVVKNNTDYGVFLFADKSSAPIDGFEISGVVAYGHDRNGIGVWADASTIKNGEITGCRCYNNGQDTSNGDTNARRMGIALVNNSGTDPTDIVVSGNRCYDTQGTKTQSRGIYHDGDFNLYTSNNIRGNKNSGFGGTLGTDSVTADNIT